VDKRAYPRLELSYPILYLTHIAARPNVGTTIDLSMGGAGVETLDTLTPGEGLELSIAIHPQVIQCIASVVHVQWPEGERQKAGVRFDEISGKDRLFLRQHLFHILEKQAMMTLFPKKPPL
jgi:c-di-GMP-binding flagellar brake protein YcgR